MLKLVVYLDRGIYPLFWTATMHNSNDHAKMKKNRNLPPIILFSMRIQNITDVCVFYVMDHRLKDITLCNNMIIIFPSRATTTLFPHVLLFLFK
jgi:hypothetical protein